MQLIWANAAMLTVAMLYCTWRTCLQVQLKRRQRLRERVVYMLWVMARHSAITQETLVGK